MNSQFELCTFLHHQQGEKKEKVEWNHIYVSEIWELGPLETQPVWQSTAEMQCPFFLI